MKDLIDFDLDVKLALEGYPEDEHNAYIYLSCNSLQDTCSAMVHGAKQPLGQALLTAMDENPDFAEIVLNVCRQYLKDENLQKK